MSYTHTHDRYTLAGVESAVVASPRLATILEAAPFHLTCIKNLTADAAFRTNTSTQIFQWAHDNYGKKNRSVHGPTL